MIAHEYKGWLMELEPQQTSGGWRIAGRLRLIAPGFEGQAPINETRTFATKQEAIAAGVKAAQTWVNERINTHPLDGREASARLQSLQDRTYFLCEALRHLREECGTEVRRREQQGKPSTDPPFDIPKLARYAKVLEDALRRAMDEVRTYHRGGEGGVFGEAWMKEMEDRFRRENEGGERQ